MGKKIKINTKMIGFISVLFMFTGIIYGCYSRDAAPQVKNSYGQSTKSRPLTEEELRKFAGTVRKVDGEAVAHYKMALYFQEQRRHKLAIDELKLVLKRDPANAKAYNAIGVSYDDLGNNDAAIDNYMMALQIDPKLDYVYNNLGYSYLMKNDMQNAVESFQHAIALNNKEKRYSNNLGLAYARQGNYELAYDQFKSQDSDANAEKMLARVMKDLGKTAEVEPVLLAVRSTPKTEAAAVFVLANAGDSSGSLDQAVSTEKQEPNTPKDAVPEVKPEIPQIVVAEVRPEVLQAAIVEVKPEVPQVVVAEVIPEVPLVAVAEVKPENPAMTPVIDNIPAAPSLQKSEEIQVAAVQPLNEQADSMAEIKKDVETVSDAASSQPSKKDNPAPGVRSIQVHDVSIQVHDVRILKASSSIPMGGSQVAHGMAAYNEIGIAVENGNGVKGAARKMAEQLRRKGFNVVKVSDARSFDHFRTKVFFEADNLEEVQRLLRVIPESPKSAELYKMENMGPPPIRLLIGKDLIKKQTVFAQGKKPATIKAASVNNISKSLNLKKKKA